MLLIFQKNSPAPSYTKGAVFSIYWPTEELLPLLLTVEDTALLTAAELMLATELLELLTGVELTDATELLELLEITDLLLTDELTAAEDTELLELPVAEGKSWVVGMISLSSHGEAQERYIAASPAFS